jgi:hypothetical protein
MSSVDEYGVPDQEEYPDPVVDSSIYDYPWDPTFNSASGVVHPSDTSMNFPFKYISFQE